MKRVLTIFAVLVVTVGLIGCGKPPKDTARKIALNYLERDGLILDDIKYLSAYSKDGGYTVNIQAGDALCEMPMIKGDKDWMAKGISCNGQFLSPEKVTERKKARFSEALKKEMAEANAKGPRTLENGIRFDKFTFDGTRFSIQMTSPRKAAELTDKDIDEGKNSMAAYLKTKQCEDPNSRNAMAVGIIYGADMNSIDGKPILSVTVSDKDCR